MNGIAFPEQYYGDGVTLRFRTANIAALETQFGATYREVVLAGLDACRPSVLTACLKAGLKRADGSRFPLMDKDCEDLPFAHDEVAPLIRDALFLAWHGVPFDDYLTKAAAEAARIEGLLAAAALPGVTVSEASP